MSAIFIIQTIVEICLALFVIWCFINEQRLIRFEDKIKAYVIYRYRRYKKRKVLQERAKLNKRSAYSPKQSLSSEPLNVA